MALGQVGKIVKNVAGGFFNRTLNRLKGAGITTDSRIVKTRAKWSGRADKKDWRVRLQIPQQGSAVYQSIFGVEGSEDNQLMKPLVSSRGMFWPLTPTMTIQHSANYNTLEQTHSNYPHYAYNNSQVDQLNIIGEFPVQNPEDARHWVATINFLRAVTKMFFGQDEGDGLKGNPPPILHLSGYGDRMFNKVPVVVNTFNCELKSGIDYISTREMGQYERSIAGGVPDMVLNFLSNGIWKDVKGDLADYTKNVEQTWAPTLSNISVLVTPIYSRDSVQNFSMRKFVTGQLDGKGKDSIGFI